MKQRLKVSQNLVTVVNRPAFLDFSIYFGVHVPTHMRNILPQYITSVQEREKECFEFNFH